MSKRAYDYNKKVEIVLKRVDEGVSLSQLAELYSANPYFTPRSTL